MQFEGVAGVSLQQFYLKQRHALIFVLWHRLLFELLIERTDWMNRFCLQFNEYDESSAFCREGDEVRQLPGYGNY